MGAATPRVCRLAGFAAAGRARKGGGRHTRRLVGMSSPASANTMLNTLSVGTAGPRIAFLHGLFGQGRNWNQIAKAVSGPDGSQARCLLVDLPDHGRSPWS